MVLPVLSAQKLDDFAIVRAVAFANKIERMMTRDVLRGENVPDLVCRPLSSTARLSDCHLAMIIEKTSLDPAHAGRVVDAMGAEALIPPVTGEPSMRGFGAFKALPEHENEIAFPVLDAKTDNAVNLFAA